MELVVVWGDSSPHHSRQATSGKGVCHSACPRHRPNVTPIRPPGQLKMMPSPPKRRGHHRVLGKLAMRITRTAQGGRGLSNLSCWPERGTVILRLSAAGERPVDPDSNLGHRQLIPPTA